MTTIRRTAVAAVAMVGGGALALASGAPGLSEPAKVLDGNTPLDVDVGHATPNVVDWDGDGKRDLLVGQFGDGKLRVYLTAGTDAAPKFKGFEYVKAGSEDATVPVS